MPAATVAAGTSALLATILFASGWLKLTDPRPFGWAMLRLMGPNWVGWRVVPPRRAGRIAGSIEVSGAIGLLLLNGTADHAIAVWVLLLCVVFVAAVARAIRKGTSCGCWGSFSDGVAGGAELGRAVGLAMVAACNTWARFDGGSPWWSAGAVAAAGASLALVVGTSWLGGRILPTRSKAKPSRAVGTVAVLAGQVAHGLAAHNPPAPRR